MVSAVAATAVLALAAAPLSSSGLHAQEAADTTITIRTTGSNLEFSPARVAAKEGTRVRIRYVNDGTLPHNIVLVTDESDIDMLGLAAFQASRTDYIPLEHEARMIAHTKLAVPGETVEMTFTVPPAGDYFLVCLYAGHYNMMVATFRSLK
jgi:azurin